MDEKTSRPGWQIGVLVLIAVGGVLAGSLFAKRFMPFSGPATPTTKVAAVYARPRPIAEFRLTDDTGAIATRATFAGHWSLLFFGYTHCPDVCPATLAELAIIVRSLGDLPPAQRPTVYLVSVDPLRDDSSTLEHYVHFFDSHFRALTGEPAALDAFTKSLGVAVIVRREKGTDYTVDHTAAILLVNPDANLAAVFPAPHVVASVAADYRAIVAHRTGAGGQ